MSCILSEVREKTDKYIQSNVGIILNNLGVYICFNLIIQSKKILKINDYVGICSLCASYSNKNKNKELA